MSHPLSSAHIDAAVDRVHSDARDDHGSRRSSQESAHRPGVASPLSAENQVDIEKDAARLTSARSSQGALAGASSTQSPTAFGKRRETADDGEEKHYSSHERLHAIKQPPSPTFSAIRGSLTAASTRPGHGVGDLGMTQDSVLNSTYNHSERRTAETATSPLHVDMSTIPSIHAIPQYSPEATFTMNDAYNMGYVTPANEEADPLLLRSKMVNAEQELRRRPSQGRRADKRVRNYYERQNTLIENLLKPISKHASEDEEEAEEASSMVRFLIYLNIGANFVLAGLQLYAAISSLSLSLFATAADSVFDPFANVILNWVHHKSKRLDERKWPIGGSRIENAGNIAYAAIMGCVSVVLIVESARDIGSHKEGDKNELYFPSLIAVGIAFVTKAVLAILNYSYRKHSSQLEMLWVDCRNDLFINGFGIFTSAAGAKIAWWIDPTGAIIISFGIIFSWSKAAYEQFRELCGAAAPVEFLQLCTYNALHIHYQHIEMIDSVKAYHSGAKFIVEVDIVMKPETPLWLSHNVSQDLQDKIEQLPMCERAFVHVDFEVDHRPEHSAQKKVK